MKKRKRDAKRNGQVGLNYLLPPAMFDVKELLAPEKNVALRVLYLCVEHLIYALHSGCKMPVLMPVDKLLNWSESPGMYLLSLAARQSWYRRG